MENSSLSNWLKALESGGSKAINLGLEKCSVVKSNLNLSLSSKKVVTVAGTNGKGSSIALLESILLKLGYEVGTYTSPHIRSFNERIKINGKSVLDRTIVDAFSRVESGRRGIELTYFEFSTLAAFFIFERMPLDFVLLEVGLGGRLDAVNTVNPDFCLITSIGLDHQEHLGHSRYQIGYEKAGIMRSDVLCVCSDPEMPSSILNRAHQVGCELKIIGVDFFVRYYDSCWDWWDEKNSIEGLSKDFLKGDHQIQNAAGAFALVDQIEGCLDGNLVKKAIADVGLEGRFQELEVSGRKIILDVAHNPQSAAALALNLFGLGNCAKTFGVVSLMKTKDLAGFLSGLVGVIDIWIFPTLAHTGMHSNLSLQKELSKIKKNTTSICCDSVEEAMDLALTRSGLGDVIVACGSFMMVGKVTEYLEGLPRK